MPEFAGLHVETIDQIAHIWLNRPAKANALNGELWHSLRAAFHYFDCSMISTQASHDNIGGIADIDGIQQIVDRIISDKKIDEQNLERMRFEQTDRLLQGMGTTAFIAILMQRCCHKIAEIAIIIDYQE